MQRGSFLLALLLLLSALAVIVADPCASFTNCGECRNSSFVCHWCKDSQCHAKASIHGCLYGTYCYDNNQCQRKAPEFTGYAPPSFGAVLGVALVGGTIAMCAIAAIVLARDFAKQEEEDLEFDMGYYALSDDEADEEEIRPPTASAPAAGAKTAAGTAAAPTSTTAAAAAATAESAKVASIGSGRGWRLRRGLGAPVPRSSDIAQRYTRRRRRRTPLAGRVYTCTRLVCGTCLGIVLALGAVVLLYTPHAPGVNVCNTEFDWGSIVHSIKKIDVEADFQILVSIYNPNYLDLNVEGGNAVLRHKHVEVGQMVFDPFVSKGGYTTDVLLTVQIDAKTWDDLRLGLEYQTNVLAFMMDATVMASVTWRGHKTLPFTFTIANYYIKVADTTGYDRSLCNCPQMMQSAAHLSAAESIRTYQHSGQ